MKKSEKIELAEKALRRMIGALPSGAILPGQRELCAEFGITTFCLHKLLHQMAGEGLVDIFRSKGVFVRPPSVQYRKFLRIVYFDLPERVAPELAQGAFAWAAGRRNLECRTVHLQPGDISRLGEIVADCAREKACIGLVVTGYIEEKTAGYLERTDYPYVVFGDVYTSHVSETLRVVRSDCFQGAMDSVDFMVKQGCETIVAGGFFASNDRPWVRDARSGALAAAESHPDIKFFMPSNADFVSVDSKKIKNLVKEYAGNGKPSKIGIVCYSYGLCMNTGIELRRTFQETGAEVLLLVMGINLPIETLHSINVMDCTMQKLVDVSMRRLVAIRRGADSKGRILVPYELRRT